MSDSFVFGFALDHQGGGSALNDEMQNLPDNTWIHLDFSQPDAEYYLKNLDVDDAVIEALLRSSTRPRCIATNSGIFLTLRAVNTNPGSDPEDMVSLRLLIQNNRLVTLRQRKLFTAQDMKADIERSAGPSTIAELVVGLIEKIADRIERFVFELEEQMDQLEENAEHSTPNEIRAHAAQLRRQAATVRRFLAPQREALDGLSRLSSDLLSAEQIFQLRDQTDRIARHVEELDLLRERALLVQEELMNQLAQEQNNRMYVLSIIAAIFLPITFLTGIFGMNVAGLPGTENEYAFWVVAIGMVAIGIGTIILLRKNRWL